MMKVLYLLTLLSGYVLGFELQGGDVILQSLDCYRCDLIRQQEASQFTHIGVIVETENGLEVAQALGRVKVVSLKKFLKQSKRSHKVIRSHDSIDSHELTKIYFSFFDGLPYDSGYRWNDQSMYCSELVYKLLREFNIKLPHPKKMLFNVNNAEWRRIFGKIPLPIGELGISPGDFDRTKTFWHVGNL